MKYDSALRELAGEISTFLKSQGGASNGYDTHAEGEVIFHGSEVIHWMTPTLRDLDVQKRLGRDLYKALEAILKRHGLPGCSLTSNCDTRGCYVTKVRVYEETTVELDGCQ